MKPWAEVMLGAAGAFVINTALFVALDPRPGTSAFTQLNLVGMAIVTAVAACAVVVSRCDTATIYRALFGGLVASVVLWDARTPSTTDGFAKIHWVSGVVASMAALAVVVAIDEAIERRRSHTR